MYLCASKLASRAGLEAWLGAHITFVSGLFVVVVVSTGDLLFMLCLLTIVSDAALVARTFEITHFSNFESRWLLPVWLFGELGISLLHALFQLHTVSLIRNTPLKRPKRSPRGVHVIFDPATTKPRRHFFVVISSFVVCHFVIFTQAPKGRN